MKYNESLRKLGLSKEESDIYIGLLELGPSTITVLSRHIGLHRPGIYKNIPKLKEIGLITEFPKGRQKHYSAEPPEKLKNLFDDMSKKFEVILPELEQLYKAKGKMPVIKYLEGRKGLQFVFHDIVTTLKRGDTFHRYSSAKDRGVNEGKYLPPDYERIRDNKGLQRQVITSKEKAVNSEKNPSLNRSVKLVPESFGLFDYDVTQIIYANKIAFVDYNTETAIIIENAPVAEFQRKIFKLLWNKL